MNKKYIDRETINRFFAPLKKHKVVTGVTLFQVVFWSLSGLFLIYLNEQIAVATELGSMQMISEYLVIFALLTVTAYLGEIFFKKYYDILFWRVQNGIYKEKLKETVNLDNNMFESIGTGYFNSVLQRGGDNWARLLQSFLTSGIDSVIQIVFAFILIYSGAGWEGVLVAGICFVIAVLVMNRGTVISMPWRRKKRKTYGLLDKQVVRIIMSKFEVLLNSQIGGETKKLDKKWEDIIKYHNVGDWKGIIVAYIIPNFLNEVLRGLVYFFVGVGVITGKYTIADFVLLISIVELFRKSIQNLTSVYREFAKNFLYVSRLWNMFDTIPSMKSIEKGEEFVLKNANFSIDNLSYQYKQIQAIKSIEKGSKDEFDGIKVFENFSLDIMGGKKTAFVGVSGSGKSTLIKLLAGYLKPTKGSILIDGQDLANISLKSYYQHIGYLTQEASVFDGSVRENLTYSIKGEVDEKEIEKAIKLAECEFIYDFANGLDTEIGERGIRLSGGQRQRLAIAKVFLKNPEIVLLDEPTSALDSFSEQAITKAMKNLFEGRTVVIIAHRLQTVKEADDIIVFEQGKVIERGTHKELVEKDGSYAKMLELQSGF